MHTIPVDRFEGCLLGLALGDALGAPHEGGVIERLLWRAIGTTRRGEMRWTDDTQMALDVAASLLAQKGVAPDDLAQRFARSYRWHRGYGPGAARLLRRIARGEPWQEANRSVYLEGSFGNGGAMRAPVLALHHAADAGRLDALDASVAQVTCITHAHPWGIEGAQLVAVAAHRCLHQWPVERLLADLVARARSAEYKARLDQAAIWIAQGAQPAPRETVARLGNGVAAIDSCITGIYLALRFADHPFADMLDFVARCGGDADTIGSMAGSLWGARRGRSALPAASLARLEAGAELRALAQALHAASMGDRAAPGNPAA